MSCKRLIGVFSRSVLAENINVRFARDISHQHANHVMAQHHSLFLFCQQRPVVCPFIVIGRTTGSEIQCLNHWKHGGRSLLHTPFNIDIRGMRSSIETQVPTNFVTMRFMLSQGLHTGDSHCRVVIVGWFDSAVRHFHIVTFSHVDIHVICFNVDCV